MRGSAKLGNALAHLFYSPELYKAHGPLPQARRRRDGIAQPGGVGVGLEHTRLGSSLTLLHPERTRTDMDQYGIAVYAVAKGFILPQTRPKLLPRTLVRCIFLFLGLVALRVGYVG